MIAQPDTVTVPETVTPGAGASICTVGITAGVPPVTETVTLDVPVSGVLSVSVAETVIVCDPAVNVEAFSEYEYPTFGQPGRPGYAEHTSGRLKPYVAVPTVTPSTATFTLPIAVPAAVALSIAQPETVTVPETLEPGAGASICTVGGPDGTELPLTVTVTLDAPVSGAGSVSVAETVIVCDPEVSVDVFRE